MPVAILVLALEVLLGVTVVGLCASEDSLLGAFIAAILGLLGPIGAIVGWRRGKSGDVGKLSRIRTAERWGLALGVVPALVLLVMLVPLSAFSGWPGTAF